MQQRCASSPSSAVQIAEKGPYAGIFSQLLVPFAILVGLVMSFHHVQLQESCHIVLLSVHLVSPVHVGMLYSSLCPHAYMHACAVASDGVGM